ncbi:MAG: hypothetical protein HYX59_08020 [Elusimicrobia bacterium]|nr:hypothetical protein [Elusimicrobiota bacterium]
MSLNNGKIVLDDDDLKLIFSLFCSSTKHERAQTANPASVHHFSKVELSGEYSLTQERREFAVDAWRAVLQFLRNKGVVLRIGTHQTDLEFIEESFLD